MSATEAEARTTPEDKKEPIGVRTPNLPVDSNPAATSPAPPKLDGILLTIEEEDQLYRMIRTLRKIWKESPDIGAETKIILEPANIWTSTDYSEDGKRFIDYLRFKASHYRHWKLPAMAFAFIYSETNLSKGHLGINSAIKYAEATAPRLAGAALSAPTKDTRGFIGKHITQRGAKP